MRVSTIVEIGLPSGRGSEIRCKLLFNVRGEIDEYRLHSGICISDKADNASSNYKINVKRVSMDDMLAHAPFREQQAFQPHSVLLVPHQHLLGMRSSDPSKLSPQLLLNFSQAQKETCSAVASGSNLTKFARPHSRLSWLKVVCPPR